MTQITIKELRSLIRESIQKQILTEGKFTEFLDDAKNKEAIRGSLELLKKIGSGTDLTTRDLAELPGKIANVVPVLTKLSVILAGPQEAEEKAENAENLPSSSAVPATPKLSTLGARFQKGLRGIGSALGLTESQQRIVEKMIREEIAKAEKENSRNRGTKAKKG